MEPKILLPAFIGVLMGLIGKGVGCGSIFKAFKYDWRESAIGGVGMMARGEVALIVTGVVTNQAALGLNALPPENMVITVLLILVSSILTHILLNVLYKGSDKPHKIFKDGKELPVHHEIDPDD